MRNEFLTAKANYKRKQRKSKSNTKLKKEITWLTYVKPTQDNFGKKIKHQYTKNERNAGNSNVSDLYGYL